MAYQKPIPPLPKPSSKKKATPAVVKYYLVAFNLISAAGWAYVIILTLVHLFNLDGNASAAAATSQTTASSTLTRFLSSIPFLRSTALISSTSIESRLPPYLQPLYRRSTSTFARVGAQTAFVQTLAVLEVVHVLLGWVRSPLQTTVMQVSSRLVLVWAIVEQYENVRSNPLYTSMVIAWSVTEVVRYPYYACSLLGYEPYLLTYLRYTTFYVLYPLGASSEAFLIYATLPASSPIPGWKSWLQGMWKPTDYFRAALFVIWWNGLYIMYTYMIAQRRKVLGSGRRLGGQPKGVKAN